MVRCEVRDVPGAVTVREEPLAKLSCSSLTRFRREAAALILAGLSVIGGLERPLHADSSQPSPMPVAPSAPANRYAEMLGIVNQMNSRLNSLDPDFHQTILEFARSIQQSAREPLRAFLADRLPRREPTDFDELRSWLRYCYLSTLLGQDPEPAVLRSRDLHLRNYLQHRILDKRILSFSEIDCLARQVYQLYELLPQSSHGVLSATLDYLDRRVRALNKTELQSIVNQRRQASEATAELSSKWGASELDTVMNPGIIRRLFGLTKDEIKSAVEANKRFIRLENGRWCYKLNSRGGCELWMVEIRFPERQGDIGMAVMRKLSRSDCFRFFKLDKFLSAVKADSLSVLLNQTIDDYDSEQGPSAFADYDIPTSAKVTYLRIYPDNSDSTIGGAISDSFITAAALKLRYGERLNITAPQVVSDTVAVIEKACRLARDTQSVDGAARKIIYLDFYCHGGTDLLSYTKILKPAELIAVIERNSDCSFIVSTMACHGGGLIPAVQELLRDKPAVAERVILMTQAKPDSYNFISVFLPIPSLTIDDVKYGGSLYADWFNSALLDVDQIKGFGACHIKADKETKRHRGSTDAEALFKGKKISQVSPPQREISGDGPVVS